MSAAPASRAQGQTQVPPRGPVGASLPPAAQVGLLAGPFLSMVDSDIVNVALPAIAAQLHTALDTAQWIISGYLLALAAGLAASAYLAKRLGTLRVYLASLVGFTLASALCALAPAMGLLIAARAVQGILGAPLLPLAMTMLIGRGNRGGDGGRQMPAAAGVLLFLAPALGPTLGGVLLHLTGWPSIFLINVPFGLIGTLAVARLLAASPEHGDATVQFDPLGLLLLADGLVLAIYGATQGPQDGWGSRTCWPYLASGLVLLGAYIPWALRRAHPALDLRLLRRGQAALAVVLCALVSIVMFALVVLIPLYMEDLQGLAPLVAGLALLPQGLVTGVGMRLGRRVAQRQGVRRSALAGLAILALGTVALLAVTATTPAWVTALILCVRGLALGLTIRPLLNTLIGGLAQEEIADGNTLFNVTQRLGGSIGIPLLTTFFAVRERARVDAVLHALGGSGVRVTGGLGLAAAHLPAPVRERLTQAAVAGFHDTIWLLVAVSALGVGTALLLRDRAPAETAPAGSSIERVE